jgi:hypothetical protein
MKLISASLLAVAAADKWAKLGDTWNSLGSSNSVSEDDRKIIDLFTISSVANYGCWCRFNQYKPYKGTPQDTVDEACKQWYQNTDCLKMDYSTQDAITGASTFQCDDTIDYVDVITDLADPFDDTTDYAAACALKNPGNDCAAGACHVDAVFIRHVFNFLSDNTLNMTLSGWYGFNGNVCTGYVPFTGTTAMPATTGANAATTMAAGTTATPVPSRACCGSYPTRFPYKTAGGDRQCCVDTSYNINILECCATGGLAVIGTCP